MSRAYGNPKYRVLINPCKVFCYHPSCMRSVHLKHIFDVGSYVRHLKDHSEDEIGVSMHNRFLALERNLFITEEELNNISKSPYVLNPHIDLNPNAIKQLEDFGILRIFQADPRNQGSKRKPDSGPRVYICHWKEKLILTGVIDPSHLSFQEDDALITTLLHFPNPVTNWSFWGTLSLYSLKLLTSISAAALNLYRGITRSRITAFPAVDVKQYAKEINHAVPSVSRTRRRLPPLNYGSDVWHKSEQITHLRMMMLNPGSVAVTFHMVKRFLLNLGADEQEINAGTHCHKRKLFGLKKPLTIEDIKNIGLANLGKHIATENGFITSVREYRISDLSGYMNTNIFTSFEQRKWMP